MSSGSSDTINGSLKFKPRLCNCGKRAIVKVTENDKNRGRLYYVCPNGYCAMWDWCNPIGDNTRVEAGQRTRVQGYERTRVDEDADSKGAIAELRAEV